MKNNELLNGLTWHLECMALATTAIESFGPPADPFQMRMHYSLYITNLMSAIDMMGETFVAPFRNALNEKLSTSTIPGSDVLNYMRELRNGVVHRGVDPTSGGVVIEGIVCAIAPLTVYSRPNSKGSRDSYTAPAHLLRDLFIYFENRTKPVIEQHLEPIFNDLETTKPEAILSESLSLLNATPHVPDWVKTTATANIEPKMVLDVQANQITKMRALLKPSGG